MFFPEVFRDRRDWLCGFSRINRHDLQDEQDKKKLNIKNKNEKLQGKNLKCF